MGMEGMLCVGIFKDASINRSEDEVQAVDKLHLIVKPLLNLSTQATNVYDMVTTLVCILCTQYEIGYTSKSPG